MRKLTARQQRFCEEYKKDRDATRAALRAGYAEKQAARMGTENLRKAHIRERLRAGGEKEERGPVVDREETLEYMSAVLRGQVEGIKPSDQMKAAELFGKRYGLFTERAKSEEKTESVEDFLRQLEEERSF